MAKLNTLADVDKLHDGMTAMVASLCVAMCMIISLLGIKLWWFKHRLTFNHSTTNNDSANGAQPTVAANTSSSSKDKRSAQEFNDPNEVRGVFRQRTEDDLDIVRPVKSLPPVRIKNARSTPSLLFLPPSAQRLQQEQVNTNSLMQSPPAPPPPPLKQQHVPRPAPPTPPLSSSPRTALPVPEPPARIQPVAPSLQSISTQQPPTPIPEVHMEEPIAKPVPTTRVIIAEPAIKVATHTTSDLELPQPPMRVQRSVSSGPKVDVHSTFTPMIVTSTKQNTQSMETLIDDRPAEVIPPHSDRVREQMNSMEQFNYNEQFESNDSVDAEAAAPLTAFYNAESNKNTIPQNQHEQQQFLASSSYVEFQLREDPKDATKLKWTVQRPNSFVRNDEELWQYLERQTSPISNEHPTWLELERDIGNVRAVHDNSNDDFANKIEEEFNRIRHSYEINEGDFLEINEKFNKQTQEQMQPDGYGRTIDEDWSNFEKLDEDNRRSTTTVAAVSSIEKVHNFDHGEMREIQTVTFTALNKHENMVDYENEQYQYGGEHYHDHLDDGIIEINYTRQVTFENGEDEIDDVDISNCKRLKTRRPTGYAQRIINIEEITDDESDDIDAADLEKTAVATTKAGDADEIKSKPRLKVTFDTNTEEHYLPTPVTEDSDDYDEHDDDLDDDTDSDERSTRQVPQPMQRLTKTVYSAQLNNMQNNEVAAAMLFSSQVSVNEYDITVASDSWTAIRKHRYITEELRRHSMQLDEDDEMQEPPKHPPPPPPLPSSVLPPVAAQRHPIPTMTMQEQ